MAVAAIAAKTPAGAPTGLALPDVVARDTIIAWYRSEFAAANAIIDMLCSHIAQITDGPSEYETVFTAIHRRRLNWIPVLHMQRYFSIAEVANELHRVASIRRPLSPDSVTGSPADCTVAPVVKNNVSDGADDCAMEGARSSPGDEKVSGEHAEGSQEEYSTTDSLESKLAGEEKFTESVSAEGDSADYEEEQTAPENVQICRDHADCVARPEKMKISKGFVAKEPVKGHMVNVVKGLKLYEDIFTNFELLKLTEYINGLRLAGRQGELSGETFIFFNKQVKGNKREIIQLGVPLFQPTNDEAASSIEPIPPILLSIVDHLTQWRLLPESKRPNSCIINFFDEGEHSQPYFKPPHLENPISTLFLSESTIAFGRILSTDQKGDYKGSLKLPLSEGSLLVMRGNSADMARHVICPSPSKRVTVTFLKVRPGPTPPASEQSKAVAIWAPAPARLPAAMPMGYGPHAMLPAWGLSLRAPVFMLGPAGPVVMGQGRRAGRGGTGVFLPWAVAPKKYTKHLPPRIQKRRLPAPPVEERVEEMAAIQTVMV